MAYARSVLSNLFIIAEFAKVIRLSVEQMLLLHVVGHSLKIVVIQELLNEVHMSHKHPPAAVPLQAQGIQSVPVQAISVLVQHLLHTPTSTPSKCHK